MTINTDNFLDNKINELENNSIKPNDKINLKKQTTDTYIDIPLEYINGKSNIRNDYNEERIIELAKSMKIHGQLEPICVYRKESKYYIIYGHLRYAAALFNHFNDIKCIVRSEPEEKELIYLQMIENIHSENLTAKDLELCIKKLLDLGDSYENISKMTGKSVSWTRECSVSANIRINNQVILDNSGLEFSTNDMYQLRNATEEEILEVIDKIGEDASMKKKVLKDLNVKTKKKKNVGRKPKILKKEIETSNSINENINSPNSFNEILFSINRDENEKTLYIKLVQRADLDDTTIDLLIAILKNFYTEKGYK